MSTSDQPESGSLTRKQLREVRLTGSTPVVTPQSGAAPASAQPAGRVAVNVETAPTVTPVVPAAPLPRAAEPIEVPPAETVEAATTPDAPMTRKRARAQERLRTGSIATGSEAEAAPAPTAPDVTPEASRARDEVAPAPIASVPVMPAAPAADVPTFTAPAFDAPAEQEAEAVSWDSPVSKESVSSLFDRPAEESAPFAAPSFGDLPFDRQTGEVEVAPGVAENVPQPQVAPRPHDSRPKVNPGFGEALLAKEDPRASRPSNSFGELLTAGDSTGSSRVAPSALIYSQTPGAGSLSGPVPTTGEILITGMMSLPDGIGSQGHAIGAADGKEVDAVLLDGEIPAASSPVPIAASSAISTIKPAGEVIRPPEPDKGNKLMLALTITAGALALALVGALVVAFTTGVFS